MYIVSEGLVEISLPGKQPITIGAMEMFGESALKDNGRRLGEAKCLQDTECLVIGKKDIEKALGSNVKNLIYYNIQKWALLRTEAFKEYNSVELNNIILGFESIYKEDGEKINPSKFNGLVIAL
jgi:CRP-like cAMP-binding protein